MDLRTLVNPSLAARASVRLIGQGPGPAYAGYEVSLGDIDLKLSAALSLSGYSTYETWAGLAAITGTPGAHAIILNDPGNHTDPVVGGTVPNTGIFKWITLPVGWKRIADTQAMIVAALLADPGFLLVAGDLEGANTIGTVAALSDELQRLAMIAAAAGFYFASTGAGVAATDDGDPFYVRDGDNNLALYLNVADVAVAQNFSLPSAAYLAAQVAAAEAAAAEAAEAAQLEVVVATAGLLSAHASLAAAVAANTAKILQYHP